MDSSSNMEYRVGLEKQNKRNDQITELILDNCRSSQISGLSDEFVNLETLSLINVGLVTLKGFPKLPKLKKLELGDNRLSGGLNLLHGSPKLQHLNISGNRIKDFEALEPLKEFHDLVNLDLYNCEITRADDYREKVFNLLPNLHSLDGYDRNEREVADSDESDDEVSDAENHITRDDNDLDEEEEADDESSEYEDEEYNGVEMSYDEEDEDDEDENDVDDEEGADDDEDEEFDDSRGTGPPLSSGGTNEASPSQGNDPNLGQLGTIENGDDDDDVEEIDDEEDEGSDLKQLQRDISDDEDSDDDDFEPDQEPDERDYEIDPEDDGDVDESGDPLSTSNTSAANLAEVESKQRGQKRKHEDEGGDDIGS